jgi:hypothetical protein
LYLSCQVYPIQDHGLGCIIFVNIINYVDNYKKRYAKTKFHNDGHLW